MSNMLGVKPACDGEEAARMSEVHRAGSAASEEGAQRRRASFQNKLTMALFPVCLCHVVTKNVTASGATLKSHSGKNESFHHLLFCLEKLSTDCQILSGLNSDLHDRPRTLRIHIDMY